MNYSLTNIYRKTIGSRKTQEDRFCICNKLINGHDDVCFFGVFDGTVGKFSITIYIRKLSILIL